MLYNDIPTLAQIERLASVDGGWRISIFLETGVLSQEGELARIALKDATRVAVDRLEGAGATSREVRAIREHLEDIIEDSVFWNHQSRSLAVFADTERALTFRLPNHFTPLTSVGNRFVIKPLLRTLSFPQSAFILALSVNDVHLIEITPSGAPRVVENTELPKDFDDAMRTSIHSGTGAGRIVGKEGEKTRLRQYARVVDRAVRSALRDSHLPLILAAAEPLESIFRGVSTLPELAERGIRGNTETQTDAELADTARGILDEMYADDVKAFAELLGNRENSGRAATDLSDIARAAALGAIHTLVFDMDVVRPGSVNPSTGEVTIAGEDGPIGIVEDIVRLALASGSRIIAVRHDEVPGGGEAAAVLRYAV